MSTTETKTEYRPCDETGMCPALHARTDDPASTRRGFRAIHTVDPTAMVGNVTTRFMGVAYHYEALRCDDCNAPARWDLETISCSLFLCEPCARVLATKMQEVSRG